MPTNSISARFTILPAVVIALVAASVIGALVLAGSPAQQRRKWADGVRVERLQSLKAAVDSYYRERKRLPRSLAELKTFDANLEAADPLTDRPFGYRCLSTTEYELTARFADRAQIDGDGHDAHYTYIDKSQPFWKHGAGSQTFHLKAAKPPAK